MNVLVIGGTGPTGPLIVNGLVERSHRVTILHTGRHEVDTLPPTSTVPHIHADPFDRDSFTQAIAGRTFDVVFAMYGRLRMIVELLIGHTPRLISIGGVPVYPGFSEDTDRVPAGMRLGACEDDAFNPARFAEPRHSRDNPAPNDRVDNVRKIIESERLIVADGGRSVETAAYVENVAHAVLLAVDRLDASAGRV